MSMNNNNNTFNIANDNKALASAIKLVKMFEGLSLKSYKCSANVWTIGYGNTEYLKTFKDPTNITITQEKAQELLMYDITKYYNAVYSEIGKICNDRQIASLTSFCFNVGINAFKKSTLLTVIKNNPHDFINIKIQFLKWNKARGKIVNGLTKRRLAEYDFYIS